MKPVKRWMNYLECRLMGKRAVAKSIGKRYLKNGKEVDINEYLGRNIHPIALDVEMPFVNEFREMSFDDLMQKTQMGSSLKVEDVYELPTYESKLSKEHIAIVLSVANKYVFLNEQTADDMLEWLACENKKAIQVKSNGLLAYMMFLLYSDDWICQNWQMVADEQKTFVSKNGLPITKKNLSRSLSVLRSKSTMTQQQTELSNAIMGLKR